VSGFSRTKGLPEVIRPVGADTPKINRCLHMKEKLKFKRHKPFHLYLDERIYFVTTSTLNKERFFDTRPKKKIITDKLEAAATKYKVRVYAWVILSNHYHFLFRFRENQNLGKLIGFINGGSSFELNSSEDKKGRHIWWNYWDNCIRNEQTFYRRFNYIHHNPVKHGYVKRCENYEFSSYNYYLRKLGRNYMDSIFAEYPIIHFTDRNDEF
jgi:putative transposase